MNLPPQQISVCVCPFPFQSLSLGQLCFYTIVYNYVSCHFCFCGVVQYEFDQLGDWPPGGAAPPGIGLQLPGFGAAKPLIPSYEPSFKCLSVEVHFHFSPLNAVLLLNVSYIYFTRNETVLKCTKNRR